MYCRVRKPFDCIVFNVPDCPLREVGRIIGTSPPPPQPEDKSLLHPRDNMQRHCTSSRQHAKTLHIWLHTSLTCAHISCKCGSHANGRLKGLCGCRTRMKSCRTQKLVDPISDNLSAYRQFDKLSCACPLVCRTVWKQLKRASCFRWVTFSEMVEVLLGYIPN